MPRIVVIGAGVIGASVAYRLAKAGADVTVLEATRPAAGTSSNSFAWANANDKPPPAYFELNWAGLEEHHRLAETLGGNWFHPSGNVEVAIDPTHRPDLRRRVERLNFSGYAARLIDADEAIERVPDLRLASTGRGVAAFFSREGWVDPPILVRTLLDEVRRAGGSVLYPDAVRALDRAGSRITGVIADGNRYSADVVVDCTGPNAGSLLAPFGTSIGRQRSPGLLLVTEPMPVAFDSIVHLDNLHVRPDGGGRLRFGAADLDQAIPVDGVLSVESPLCQEVGARAVRAFPILETATIEAVRIGWRAMPGDGLSAVGRVSDLTGYYLIFTHSGVTLASLLGRLAAEEILEGRRDELLGPFGPDRLVNTE
jgi:glycine/D-amino acid oxidase-like deaminating enzyme